LDARWRLYKELTKLNPANCLTPSSLLRGEEERKLGNEVAHNRDDVTHVSALPLKIRVSE